MKVIDKPQFGRKISDAEYLEYTHKVCSSCGSTKDVSQFYKKAANTTRGWYWDSHCIDCRRKQCRKYSVVSREKRNARLREWRKNNHEAALELDRRKRLSAYNLTIEQHEEMKRQQNDQCAICGVKPNRLFIDHCHITGKVRALLCPACNTFLGWYENKAEKILAFKKYVESHRSS